jgi:hypothetical protein
MLEDEGSGIVPLESCLFERRLDWGGGGVLSKKLKSGIVTIVVGCLVLILVASVKKL